MIKYVSSQVVPLTRELAATFATMPAQSGERPLKPARLAFLEQRLKQGLFYAPRWARAKLLTTGEILRLNGQHSSTMLRELPEIPTGSHVIIDDFECDDEHDAATLFMQFDPPESSRGARDILRAHGRIHPEIAHVSERNIARLMRGVVLAKTLASAGKIGRLSAGEKGEMIHKAVPFIAWGAPLLSHQILDRSPAIAAEYLTFLACPALPGESAIGGDAWKFWTLVADESHPDKDHPTRLVKRLLEELRAAPPGNKARTKNRLDDRAVVARCITAWNAFREERGISQLRYNAKDELPKPI